MNKAHLIKNQTKKGRELIISNGERNPKETEESGIAVLPEKKTQKPKRYKVLLHNDDYTTMEFVIHVLQAVFNKDIEEAKKIMFQVHHEGMGVCGVYTFEIAESKVDKVQKLARDNGHPLKCTMENE
jgi:ATP-dependent Clp protease adaptor protein ClpS